MRYGNAARDATSGRSFHCGAIRQELGPAVPEVWNGLAWQSARPGCPGDVLATIRAPNTSVESMSNLLEREAKRDAAGTKRMRTHPRRNMRHAHPSHRTRITHTRGSSPTASA